MFAKETYDSGLKSIRCSMKIIKMIISLFALFCTVIQVFALLKIKRKIRVCNCSFFHHGNLRREILQRLRFITLKKMNQNELWMYSINENLHMDISILLLFAFNNYLEERFSFNKKSDPIVRVDGFRYDKSKSLNHQDAFFMK